MIVAATHSRKPSVNKTPDWPKVKQPIGEAASREVDSAPAQAAELLEVPFAAGALGLPPLCTPLPAGAPTPTPLRPPLTQEVSSTTDPAGHELGHVQSWQAPCPPTASAKYFPAAQGACEELHEATSAMEPAGQREGHVQGEQPEERPEAAKKPAAQETPGKVDAEAVAEPVARGVAA